MGYKRISIDTSKHVFAIHGVDEAERPTLRLELRRSQIEAFFARLAPTEVALEACGGAPHWGRQLRTCGEITPSRGLLVRRYGVVPLAKEIIAAQVDRLHLLMGHRDALRVAIGVNLAADLEAGFGCRGTDELNNDLMADQRFAAPVLGDEGEQSVLDLVPLCALPRRTDVVGANPTRQLSLQPEAPGADQEATNGLKHFGKRSLLGISGPYGPQHKRTPMRPRKDQM